MKHKNFAVIAVLLVITAFLFCGCVKRKNNTARDNLTQDAVTSGGTAQEENQETPTEERTPCEKDNIEDRISFGKKYYYLGYDGYVEQEYYTFNKDGSASYTHVIRDGNKTTFHQQINFRWTYIGNGKCVLMHNGTKIIKGAQDDAFGFSRVMQVGKEVVYWSASGENAYFICEDFLNQIPDYAKIINS